MSKAERGVQRSVVFTRLQWKWLNAQAEKLGISFAEVLRRMIDRAREGK